MKKVAQIEDPTGRLDILLSGIIEKSVQRLGDPALLAWHGRYKAYIGQILTNCFGPVESPKRRRRARASA
jgi:hypothetical protein